MRKPWVLVNRDFLTIWVSKETIAKWQPEKEPKQRGRQQEYSNLAIETDLTLKRISSNKS